MHVKRDLYFMYVYMYSYMNVATCSKVGRRMCIMSKETHFHVKKDPHSFQKRPTMMAKETHIHVKRDVRLTYMSKDTYIPCV